MPDNDNIADHLYVRFRGGRLEAVRHRFRRDSIPEVTKAVNVSAEYGLVLCNFGEKAAYDIAKSEDDTLQRLMDRFRSIVIRREYLIFEDIRHNDTFRQTWKELQPA
jgi:hypothetical protein